MNKQNILIFVKDLKGGGMLVACSECGKEFSNKENKFPPAWNGKLYWKCPDCESILQYPDEAD